VAERKVRKIMQVKPALAALAQATPGRSGLPPQHSTLLAASHPNGERAQARMTEGIVPAA